VSKVCAISMARIATQVMLGEKLSSMNLVNRKINHFGVKEAVFPFSMFPEVDPLLGPEMRSTGEVLGLADDFGMAYFKSQEAAKAALPVEGSVLISVNSRDHDGAVAVGRKFQDLGFTIKATEGTRDALLVAGVKADVILKEHEGRPNVSDGIKNGEINLVINTPVGKLSQHDDSYIRKAAIKYGVPYITTITAALAAADGIASARRGKRKVRSLQQYHADIMASEVLAAEPV
jgi:carbamoyl-phosphate synthase large subunit